MRDGDLVKLRAYLAILSASNPQEDHLWSTPLHVAVWCSNLEAARVLLDVGEDTLHEKQDGLHPYSSLALSAELGFGEMARLTTAAVPPHY